MKANATPYSNLKIFSHTDKIAAMKKGERTAPLYIRIKPTNVCNHHCFYCSYADDVLALRDDVNPKDYIPQEKMREIIADLGDMGVRAVTFSGGGDPLVYPYILETMQGVLERGINLSIITNGQRLKGEIAETLTAAKWVRISMDAARAETFAQIRRIPEKFFRELCDNIRRFAGSKPGNCEFGINFVINHLNQGQVFEMAEMVKDLGVNHIKFAARITKDLEKYHAPFKQEVIEQIHRAVDLLAGDGFAVINKYEEDFDTSGQFHRTYKKCFVKEVVTCIAADSKVYFCHDKAYVKTGAVGDLKDRSFRDLWFSPEVQKRYREFDAAKECAHHCVYDDRNILLNTFFSLKEEHINFI